ncbi:MAG: CoB--CoM heterodisulfide reductase iron-sulfur subunit A family protein, partial [Dehalococcoidia bacterium]
GEITEVYQEDKKIVVSGKDLEKGESVKIPADLVVLAVGMTPSVGTQGLARTLNISYDDRGFVLEAHPKLRPVETATDGIFLAGTCLAPFDIPESVAQGGAAAAQVITLFSHDTLSTEPTVAAVDSMKCNGCLLCADVCPFNAIDSEVLRDGRTVAMVNESVCKGCGLCVSACRSQVVNLRGFSPQQLFSEVMALWQ